MTLCNRCRLQGCESSWWHWLLVILRSWEHAHDCRGYLGRMELAQGIVRFYCIKPVQAYSFMAWQRQESPWWNKYQIRGKFESNSFPRADFLGLYNGFGGSMIYHPTVREKLWKQPNACMRVVLLSVQSSNTILIFLKISTTHLVAVLAAASVSEWTTRTTVYWVKNMGYLLPNKTTSKHRSFSL